MDLVLTFTDEQYRRAQEVLGAIRFHVEHGTKENDAMVIRQCIDHLQGTS